MMSTTNRIFLDSSIIIEAYKGNNVDFFHRLISDLTKELFINEIVLSEVMYYVLALSSNVSPRTLQEKRKIKHTIEEESKIISALKNFNFLSGNKSFISEVPRLMARYNLLPNDAVILATCKFHKAALASHDSDFIKACELENIDLIKLH